MLTILSLIASAWVLLMYWWMVRTGETAPFNLANAVGGIPIALVSVLAHAWAPLTLTVAFTLTGWYGLLRGHLDRHGASGYAYVEEWDQHQAHVEAYNTWQDDYRARLKEIHDA